MPSNGALIKFDENPIFSSVLLKEILYDNRIYLLYKLSLVSDGDLSGLYDTKDRFFYSIVFGHKLKDIEELISGLVLMCYAAYTTSEEKYQLSRMGDFFTLFETAPLKANGYLQGGKLRNVYDNAKGKSTGNRIGNDDYTTEERAIQGFIRKLPAGQHARAEALEYAENLGYVLNPDKRPPHTRDFSRE